MKSEKLDELSEGGGHLGSRSDSPGVDEAGGGACFDMSVSEFGT